MNTTTCLMKGLYLLECNNNNTIFPWGFPRVDDELVSVLKHRSGFFDKAEDKVIYNDVIMSRFGNNWLYTYNIQIPQPTDEEILKQQPSRITRVSMTILATNYNLPQYQALCQVLGKVYLDNQVADCSAKPPTTPLLKQYLEANNEGKILYEITKPSSSGDLLTFDAASHDPRGALIQPTHLLLEDFGMEAILIFLAVLLKKRIIVYHPNPLIVSKFCRVLPTFGAWHRNNSMKENPHTNLRPFNASLGNNEEYQDVVNNDNNFQHTTTIIGVKTLDNIEMYNNLYDIVVNLEAKTVDVVASQQKYFNLVKFHKVIIDAFLTTYQQLVDSGVQDETELAQNIIKVVMVKTKEIIEIVNKCKGDDGMVSIESIKAAGVVPANLEEFMYNVAVAENLVQK